MLRRARNERARKGAARGPRRRSLGACPAAQPMLQPSPRHPEAHKEDNGWTEPS
jgi:hypothetical protein